MFASILASSVIAAIVSFIGNYILREKQNKVEIELENIKNKNVQILESTRQESEYTGQLHSELMKLVNNSHGFSQERKVVAVENVWNSIVSIRTKTPSFFIYLDVLLTEEYKIMLNDKKFLEDKRRYDRQKLLNALYEEIKNVERYRPFISMNLWFLTFTYNRFNMRLIYFIYESFNSSNTSWLEDRIIKIIIFELNIFTGDEIKQFQNMKIQKLSYIRNTLEDKILTECQKVVSGEMHNDLVLGTYKVAANFIREEYKIEN